MSTEEPKIDHVELEALRLEIDEVDEGFLALMAARRDLALRIGRLKRRRGLQATDPAREAFVVRRSARMAREHGLEPECVRDVFWRLIALSHRAVAEAVDGMPNGDGA